MISLYQQKPDSRTFFSLTIPSNPRLGDCWVNSSTGEKAFWYQGANGEAAFVEFADNAFFNVAISENAINLPQNPSLSQEFAHVSRKWIWNGKIWKSKYDYVNVRGGTFTD